MTVLILQCVNCVIHVLMLPAKHTQNSIVSIQDITVSPDTEVATEPGFIITSDRQEKTMVLASDEPRNHHLYK